MPSKFWAGALKKKLTTGKYTSANDYITAVSFGEVMHFITTVHISWVISICNMYIP